MDARYAWRATGQLRLVGLLAFVDMVRRMLDDDWVTEELPVVMGMVDPPALPALRTALPRAARQPEPWAATGIAGSLERIAADFPEIADGGCGGAVGAARAARRSRMAT